MNLSILDELELFSKELQRYMSPHVLEQLARERSKILLRLFNLLQRNGRKSHRYEKKTVFDILGVVYNFSMSHKHVA